MAIATAFLTENFVLYNVAASRCGTGRVAMKEERKIKLCWVEKYMDIKNSSRKYRIIHPEAFTLSTIGNVL
jgi:hypothetical protein